MDPIKACYFFNGHNEHLMADHWDAWCFFPLKSWGSNAKKEQFYVIWHVEWDAVKGEGFSTFSASA